LVLRYGPSILAPPNSLVGILLKAGFLSLVGHGISIVIALLFLRDQGADVAVGAVVALFPAVLFAASIPVSIGGWGTRELAAAAAFGTIGLAEPLAVAHDPDAPLLRHDEQAIVVRVRDCHRVAEAGDDHLGLPLAG
ncbi:MAG: lysylphosphatidylglycerol synthase domain-containing protein, partial [Acidobacteriota bacterium]